MTKPDKIQVFIIFVLESYKNKFGKSVLDVLNDFKKHDVFAFLTEGYEVLHTQSLDYVVDEVNNYINNSK